MKENKPVISKKLEVPPLTSTKPKQQNYLYKIDNNPLRWYNQPDSFKIINEFLSLQQVTPYIFDPVKCKEISN